MWKSTILSRLALVPLSGSRRRTLRTLRTRDYSNFFVIACSWHRIVVATGDFLPARGQNKLTKLVRVLESWLLLDYWSWWQVWPSSVWMPCNSRLKLHIWFGWKLSTHRFAYLHVVANVVLSSPTRTLSFSIRCRGCWCTRKYIFFQFWSKEFFVLTINSSYWNYFLN